MRIIMVLGGSEEQKNNITKWMKLEEELYFVYFSSLVEGFSYAVDHEIDIAFINIEAGDTLGIDLGKWLRKLYPNVYLIYISSSNIFAYDAINIARCNGYLLLPFTRDELHRELEIYKRKSDKAPENAEHELFIRCFGDFEVFYDRKPIFFSCTKTKELLAYLVDRCGYFCSNAEILATLWEDDDNHISYLKKLKSDLQSTLKAYGMEHIVIKKHGGLAIDMQNIECDYYKWRDGKRNAQNKYSGEYMEQFSWAERTKGILELSEIDH